MAFRIPGPKDHARASFDLVPLHESPVARVPGVVAVVTHHEIGVHRYREWLAPVGVGAISLSVAEGGWGAPSCVRFFQRLSVNEDLVALNLDDIAGRPDNPRDEVTPL